MEIKKIYISGAHSTGKTTLINDLKPYVNHLSFEEEIARDIIKQYKWERNDFLPSEKPRNFEKLNTEILRAQISLANNYEESQRDFLCDRCMDPLAYAKVYLDDESVQRMLGIPGINEWFQKLKSALIFLVEPQQECIKDDSVRLVSTLSDLKYFTEVLKDIMKEEDVPFVCIPMLDRMERVKFVLDVIEKHYPNTVLSV
ncbi:hypothetical protein FSP39_013763 [Pinctada imbricata]|uniref:NadR/Ttd14 AAA domain-containing protein n=1 Tax=Pinctada imbricata TaxID=66713 RepID=A0AA88Y756_PINIB|nr:hypothetical protein FSP39_013763 [Pinctada imbricata]